MTPPESGKKTKHWMTKVKGRRWRCKFHYNLSWIWYINRQTYISHWRWNNSHIISLQNQSLKTGNSCLQFVKTKCIWKMYYTQFFFYAFTSGFLFHGVFLRSRTETQSFLLAVDDWINGQRSCCDFSVMHVRREGRSPSRCLSQHIMSDNCRCALKWYLALAY